MLKQETSHVKEINKQMEIEQKQINKEGFDEETKQKIQAYLEEIDRKQQKIPGKTKYIRHVFDRERKLLYFTGKFDKKEVQVTDFQTGEVVPGKYKVRYSFECYDITTTSTIPEEFQTSQSIRAIYLGTWYSGCPYNIVLPFKRQKHSRNYS
jgi:Lhr-like helicase